MYLMNPLEAQGICAEDDFMMHVEVGLLMFIDVDFEVAMITFSCGGHHS